MVNFRRHFLFALFGISFAICATTQSTKAQGAVSYSFLEVVDFADKPLANAEIKVRGSCVGGEHITDEKGQIKGGLPIGFGDCQTYDFNISKNGYFPFADIFGISKQFRERLKIELLLKPRTRTERIAIGNEQSKREFFAAAKAGDTLSVRKFIASGLNPNLTTSDLRGIPVIEQEPIILYAVSSGNGQTVKEFLSSGVSIRKKELSQNILFKYLYTFPYHKEYPVTEEEIEIYENGAASLIEAGAEFNPKAKDSVTPLMIAADKSYLRIVKLLKKKGVFLNAQDSYGRSALMYLMDFNKPKERLEIASLLIRAGAKVNLLTSDVPYSKYDVHSCKTALTVAVENFDIEMVKLLLANGANVNLTCEGGKTPYGYALELSPNYYSSEKIQIIKILEDAGAKP